VKEVNEAALRRQGLVFIGVGLEGEAAQLLEAELRACLAPAKAEAVADGVASATPSTKPQLHAIDGECFLIRSHLGLEEQAELFEYIQRRDRTVPKPRPMVPAPKTLLLSKREGDGPESDNSDSDSVGPMLAFAAGEDSVVTRMVTQANAVLEQHACHMVDGFDVREYKTLSMAVIQYESPDGRFPPHVDHCDASLVYLTSLGCGANFMVKTPNMAAAEHFQLRSGDLLVFNASSRAAITHGVLSIDAEGSGPELLARRFPVLRNHRFGVQCRMRF
jgi:hypothetical protein